MVADVIVVIDKGFDLSLESRAGGGSSPADACRPQGTPWTSHNTSRLECSCAGIAYRASLRGPDFCFIFAPCGYDEPRNPPLP